MTWWMDVSVEILSLIIGLMGIFYLLMGIKLIDHKIYYAARLFLWVFIFLILGKLIGILDILGVINATYYKAIPGLLSVISLALAMWYLNKEFRFIVNHHKIKQKKKRRR